MQNRGNQSEMVAKEAVLIKSRHQASRLCRNHFRKTAARVLCAHWGARPGLHKKTRNFITDEAGCLRLLEQDVEHVVAGEMACLSEDGFGPVS